MIQSSQISTKKKENLILSPKSSNLSNNVIKLFKLIIKCNMIIALAYFTNYITTESFKPKFTLAQTFTDIKKPKIDYREYRGLMLENQMKVLLVSDPRTQIAGASLEVLAGSWYEPSNLPGLAHFLEHMLFMGSRKYPSISEFSDYLSLNGGVFNAYTSFERTNFFFELNNGVLEQALDRFSGFFIDPLFDPEAITKEVNAVNSEYEKDFQVEEWRLQYMTQLLLNPDSPAERFYIGNRETLLIIPSKEGINVRDELIKFFNTYYSANLMALSLIGNYSLDELENMARQKFSQVKNLNTTIPDFREVPLVTSNEVPTITQYLPISQNSTLYLMFNFPPVYKYYLQKPLKYLFNLILNADNGTLPALLKEKGYISYIDSEEGYTGLNSETISSISMTLTESGMDNLFDIIQLAFEQIDLIKTNGISFERFQQYQQISQMNFDYSQWEYRMMGMASNFTTYLNRYSMEEVLAGSILFYEYDIEDINLFLRNLTFDQSLIVIASPKFNFSENSTKSVSYDIPNHKIYYGDLNIHNELYDVRYCHYSIPQQFRDYINQITYSNLSGFELPPFNKFIPKDLSLIENCSASECDQDFEDDKSLLPYLIELNELRKTFYQLDRSFLTPTIAMNLRAYSPIIHQNIQNYINSLIFCTAKSVSSEASFYEFTSVGYYYRYQCELDRIDLTIEGYSDQFLEASIMIANSLKNLNITNEVFQMSKEKIISDNASRKTLLLIDYSVDLLNTTLLKANYFIDEILQGLNNTDYITYLQNTNTLLENLFIEGIIIGNLNQTNTINILNNITNIIGYYPANQSNLLINEYLDLTNLSLVYREFSNHKDSTDNSLVNYYQDTFYNIKNFTLLQLLITYMRPEAFKTLRTEKQLGYIVGVRSSIVNRMIGMIILIQGPVMNPNDLDLQAELFLNIFENKLRNMNDTDFEKLKNGIKAQLLQTPNDLDKKLQRYILRINDKTYNFNIYNQMISNLTIISKEDLLQYYLNLFKYNQKKLSIQIYTQLNYTDLILPNNTLSINQTYSGIQPILLTNLKEIKSFRYIIPEDYYTKL